MYEITDEHLEYVYKIASKMKRRLPAHVSKDDLVGDGMVGLVQAAAKYDEIANPNVPFLGFAYNRIMGEMLDGLRRMNRDPAINNPFGLTGPENVPVPQKDKLKSRIEEMISRLTSPEKDVMLLILEGKRISGIAKSLGISRKDATRIYNRAVRRMRRAK